MKRETRDEIRKELDGLQSSFLKDFSDSGFKTPEGYFDTLPQAIQQKLPIETVASKNLFFRGLHVTKMAYAMVATVAILAVTISVLLLQKGREDGYLVDADLLANEQLITFYPGYEQQFFYDLLLESDITAEEIRFGIEFGITELDQDLVSEYLLEMAAYYSLEPEDFIFPDNQ